MKLNRNTKKAKSFIQQYDVSIDEYLTDVYDNPSDAKIEAFKICYKKAVKMNGQCLRILSYNTFMFTVGWLYKEPETGVLMLNVETAYNSYQIEY